jgi:hypothetical protein
MLTKKLLVLPFLGIFTLVLFSSSVVFAATPTISSLTTAYKTYLTPPVVKKVAVKPIKVSDLITAYKNYILPARSQDIPVKY